MEISQAFRPRARLLQLLGDELIASPRLAVFELVKNAYDADADRVVVRLELARGAKPAITVVDDGEGMTLDLLKSLLRKACSAEFLPEAAGRARVSGRDAAFAG